MDLMAMAMALKARKMNATEFRAAVEAYLEDHPEAVDQAAIEALFADQLDGIEEDLGGLKSAIEDLEAGSLSALGASSGQVPTADGEGSWDWQNQPVTDVQVNGKSILSNGVANVPVADGNVVGVVGINPSLGIGIVNDQLVINGANSDNIKAGGSSVRPVSTLRQHESVFFGLSKVAGADLASETVTLGQYPDAAKVAIQKMLGIYEPPWELIREDTVTNATEADVDITVDGNGQAFELTDVYMQVWLPQQETQASIGDYGMVQFYYNDSNYITSQMGAWMQAASTNDRFGQVLLTNENGAIKNIVTNNATKYSAVNLVGRTNVIDNDALMKIGTFSFTKSVIKKVTGTLKYKLYGRRKWN